MTILYSDNFDSYADGAVAGWVGQYAAWTIPGNEISGAKTFFPLGQVGAWAKYVGIAAQTSIDTTFYHKAVFNGSDLCLHHIGHGHNSSEPWGDFNYRCLLSGTSTGVTVNFAPFFSGNFPGNLATGAHNVAISTGDVIATRLKVSDKVISLWVWNSTVESIPASPLIAWTDTVQRAAGYLTLFQGSDSQNYGIDNLVINDVASGATSITLSGPSSGIVGVASSVFTVGADSTIAGTVVVTPSDSTGGGTFAPTTVSISAGAPTATFTYTPGNTGAKSISVTNNGGLSNPSTITYTASAVTVIPVDSSNLFWSPYSWDMLEIGDFSVSTKSKQTNLSGSYLKFVISGSTVIKLGVDSSIYGSLTPSDLPVIAWSVGYGSEQTIQLTASTSEVVLATGLSSGTTYPVVVWVKGLTNSLGDRWGSAGVSPTNAVRINGIRLDSGGTVAVPDVVLAKRSIIYGDSITEGHRSMRNGSVNAHGMGRSHARSIGEGMGSEFTQCGFSGQDYNSALPFSSTWNYHSSGRLRSFATAPNYVFVVSGSNNQNSPATVTSLITSMRASFGASTHIFICVATSGLGAASVTAGVAAYTSSNQTDLRVHLIDVRDVIPTLGMDYSVGPSYFADDGLHLDEHAQALWASAVLKRAGQLLAVEKPVSTKTVTITLKNASGTSQPSLSYLEWAWFDQSLPQNFLQPTDSGSVESTDNSGVLVITVHTNLAPGGIGWLIVTDSDGNPATVHKAFSGPVTVA